jgi:hypothetical protein
MNFFENCVERVSEIANANECRQIDFDVAKGSDPSCFLVVFHENLHGRFVAFGCCQPVGVEHGY